MKETKYYLNLTEEERSELIYSLITKKNTLMEHGKYTDLIDEVICKLAKAKRKTFRIISG